MSVLVPKTAGRRGLISAELIDIIAGHVLAGAFLGVAAEASGISARTLFAWLEIGREVEDELRPADGFELHVELVGRLRAAHANARMTAETKVHDEDPLAWLRFGPGRERPDAPGWTSPARDVRPDSASALDQLLARALASLGLGDPGAGESVAVPSTAIGGESLAHGEGSDHG